MPYRRLPNTDNSRLKALRKALAKGEELPPFKLAYSQKLYQQLQSFLPDFEQAVTLQRHAYSRQIQKNKDYQQKLQKARLYISHFIQVANMAIKREELPPSTRAYFGLSENQQKVPALNTEKEIIKWGEILIEGENKRTLKGHSPITNPTVALVRVQYEKFLEAYNYRQTLQKNIDREQDKVVQLRKDADKLILDLWNETENYYKDLKEDEKREKAKEYGVVYVYRKSEIKKLNFIDFDENKPL